MGLIPCIIDENQILHFSPTNCFTCTPDLIQLVQGRACSSPALGSQFGANGEIIFLFLNGMDAFFNQSDQSVCSFYHGTLNFRLLLAFWMPADVCFILCPLVTERFKLGIVSAYKSLVAVNFQFPN